MIQKKNPTARFCVLNGVFILANYGGDGRHVKCRVEGVGLEIENDFPKSSLMVKK